MRGCVLSLFLFLFITSAYCQDLPFQLDWSPVDTVKKTESVRGLMLANDQGVFALTELITGVGRVSEYGLVKYDGFLQPIKKSSFSPIHEGHRMTFEFSQELDGALYLFFSSRMRIGNARGLWAARLDDQSLELKDFKELIHLENEGLHAMTSVFIPAKSSDSKTLAIYYQLESGFSVRQRIRVKTFDASLNILRELDQEREDRGWLFFPQKLKVSNDGSVVLFAKRYEGERKESAWGKANYYYEVVISTETDPYKVLKLEGGEGEYLKLGVQFDAEENVICSGFFAERNATDIKGSFFIKLDLKTGKEISSMRTVFPKEFLLKNVSALKAESIRLNISTGGKKELKNYRLHSTNYNATNNGVVITAEYFESAQTDATLLVTSTSYRDLISVSLDETGAPLWYSKVEKKQESVLDDGKFSSVMSWIHNGELFLAYNENPDNLEANEYRRVKNFNPKRDAAFVVARINEEGAVKKQLVGYSHLTLVNGLPKLARTVKPGVYMLPCRKGRFMRLAKLQF